MMMKYILMAFFYLSFIGILLFFPDSTIEYAYQGLTQWATRMVPTLLPFMIISSMMIHTGVDSYLTKLLKPFLNPLFACSTNGIYVIVMGFLCGFPMGAKASCDLRKKERISKTEAEYLLAFCNNIGPTYFLGIIFPLLEQCGYHNKLLLLFGLYGIPLLYGIFLGKIKNTSHLAMNNPVTNSDEKHIYIPITTALRLSCLNSIQSILLLGGYVTFVNAFRVIPELLSLSSCTSSIIGGFLEIVYGIPRIINNEQLPMKWKAFFIMTALSFSGVCCMLQTSSVTIEEELSMKKYISHKLLITCIAAVYYFIIFI